MGRCRLNATRWTSSSADQGAGIKGTNACHASMRSRRRLTLFTVAPLLWKTFEPPNLVDYALQTGQAFRRETTCPQRHPLHSHISNCGEQAQVSIDLCGCLRIEEVVDWH